MLNGIVSLILSCILTFSSYTSVPEVEITPVPEEEHVLLEAQEGVYRIGISQLVSHVALDAATKGFKDVLTEKLGDKVMFDERNAMGDSSKCAQAANDFVKGNYDLIFANATPNLRAAANATTTIPILGTSVTEYGVALECEVVDGVVPGNISGTSDLVPFGAQVEVLVELFPNATKVALLYCSAEANSKFQVTEVAKYLDVKGIESKEFAFADSNDLATVTEAACSYADVIYVPTDNTVASSTGIIDSICRPKKIPIVAGEQGICAGCGVATLSIDYYRLGRITGEQAYRILVEGADISTMQIEYDEECTKMYNSSIAAELGITIPEDYIPVK